MITKSIWEDCLFDLKWQKEHCSRYSKKDDAILYFSLCVLPLISVIFILIDLLLLPFEIGFYFFEKWLKN